MADRIRKQDICGTSTRYKLGLCKCADCTEAHRVYAEGRRKQVAYGRWSPWVDAAPAREHVQDLLAAGMGRRQIAKLAKVDASTLWRLQHGLRSRNLPPTRQLRHATAARILAVTADLDTRAAAAVVDATGTHRRIQGLVANGWSQARLARRIGITPANFASFMKRTQVLASRARQVRDLYEQIWDTEPPCASVQERAASERAKAFAAARGWPRPMGWDDNIDDPQATPGAGEVSDEPDMVAVELALAGVRVPLQRCEVAAAVKVGTARRMSAAELADITGKSSRTVVRHRTGVGNA